MNLPRNQMRRRIAPGIWEDMEGQIHWSITELLELVDLRDTEENRRRVLDLMTEIMRREKPGCMIVYREKPD